MHRCLLLWFVGMACTTSSVVASQSWKRALPLPEASQEAVTAANAVINQSGSEECLRGKVDSRITNHGLTAADVQMFVDEIKKHPDVSVALLDAVRGEVATLMQGQRFSFDFD